MGQIAEAINSFSALSGPVTVVKEAYFEIKVTFAAIDGDVPELSVVRESGSLVFSVHTLQEGWSFFAGHSARLENVQPGSVINITSSEKVRFGILIRWPRWRNGPFRRYFHCCCCSDCCDVN